MPGVRGEPHRPGVDRLRAILWRDAGTGESRTESGWKSPSRTWRGRFQDSSLGIHVIDVREPDEYQIARVKGVPLFPLSTLPQKFTELDPNSQIYIHRKAGKRSMKALEYLRQQGSSM